jgi:lysophospholipase
MGFAKPSRRAIPEDARITLWQAPDGWKLRRFDWPVAGACRGSIMFQGGRGDVFEKYLEAFGHWHDQGWHVTSLDWRGQGGSGRLLSDPHIGHIDDFATYIADLAAFWRDWVVEVPGPHVLMGHSMGGHLALRALVEGAVRADAAVLIAPMLGLHSPIRASLSERLAKIMGAIGDPARLAWKGNERPATTTTREALLTHDHSRYEDELYWQQIRPELRMGPPSWQWLIRAFESTRVLNGDRRLQAMAVPTLLIVAEADKLVSPAAALQVAAKLPDARVVRFGAESAHEILREVDAVRDRALVEIDGFLTSRLKDG